MSFVTVCLADEQVNCHFLYDVAECRFLSRVEGNLCLEMSSDSKNYFGCVVDGILSRGHTIKSLWF